MLLDGEVMRKTARQMDPAQALLVVESPKEDYVSRGAHKLIGALDWLGDDGPSIGGARCLDAGASTGGFTDVLLRRGAKHVVAVDVGYGQIAWRLREDPRVTVVERTNVRTLDPAVVAPPPGLVVGGTDDPHWDGGPALTPVAAGVQVWAVPGANHSLQVPSWRASVRTQCEVTDRVLALARGLSAGRAPSGPGA